MYHMEAQLIVFAQVVKYFSLYIFTTLSCGFNKTRNIFKDRACNASSFFSVGLSSPPNLASALKSGLSSSGGLSSGNCGQQNSGVSNSQLPSPSPSTLKLPSTTRISKRRSNWGSRAITFCAGSFNNR